MERFTVFARMSPKSPEIKRQTVPCRALSCVVCSNTRPPVQTGTPSPDSTQGPRLDSWKAIAAYFHRDIRTVQRWERSEELPVHRHSHEKGGTVYAYQSELDLWWAARAGQQPPPEPVPEPPAKPRLKWAILLAGALAIVAAPVVWEVAIAHRSASPERITGRLLGNATAEGRSIR